MDSARSITYWLHQLEAGDPAAAQPFWERYFTQLVRLARGKLRGTRCRAADEEDVALSAFDSFCRGAAQGRFPQLNDRNNLWSRTTMSCWSSVAPGATMATPKPLPNSATGPTT